MKCIKRSTAIIITLLLVINILSVSVFASNSINLDETGSICIIISPEGVPMANVRIDLYQVAVLNSDGFFTLNAGFEECGTPGFDMSQEEWDLLANRAHSCVENNHPGVYAFNRSDDFGNTAFMDLPLGIYLAECEEFSIGGRTYTAIPAII